MSAPLSLLSLSPSLPLFISSHFPCHPAIPSNNPSKTLRATQTKNLAALLKRKLAIEQEMLDSIKRLEDAYKTGAKDVQLVARGRKEEMEKAAGGIKVATKF